MNHSTITDSAQIKLLLVEDEDRDIEIICRSIPSGIHLDVARSLKEARERLQHPDEPDCVVIDVGLPDGSGLDLIDDLAPTPAPVVILTGSDDAQVKEEAIARGAQDYLPKNHCTPDTLLRTISFAIERKKCRVLRRQLEHSERLQQVGLMTAALAHEIGNPTTFVRANLELLDHELHDWFKQLESSTRTAYRTGDDPPTVTRILEVKQLVGEAMEGVDRIAALVDQLRSISQPNGTRTIAEVNLSKVTQAALALAGTRIRESAQVTAQFPTAPVMVIGQRERIGQILSNFLLNAIQSLESQPIHNRLIEVAVENHSTYGRVVVEDNGPGIPPNVEIEQLFRPFMSTRLEQGGSGLGLAVSIQIAESLGGYIDIHRRSECTGVRAELVLPLVGCPPVEKRATITKGQMRLPPQPTPPVSSL
ncbi:MAG: hybrid sensor histidine kinase/response regulator [Myxococcales bacterium]|nr:hybrid sensor histidine kinase/response regulator [Myxococcales bacterium]